MTTDSITADNMTASNTATAKKPKKSMTPAGVKARAKPSETADITNPDSALHMPLLDVDAASRELVRELLYVLELCLESDGLSWEAEHEACVVYKRVTGKYI